MKRVFLMVCVLCACLYLCGCQKEETPSAQSVSDVQQVEQETQTWQEQYDLGLGYQENGEYTAAIIAFSNALDLAPGEDAPYAMRADAYANMGKYANAIDDYLLALDCNPGNAIYYLHLATLYRLVGQSQTELEILREGINATSDQLLITRLEELENTGNNQNPAHISDAETIREDFGYTPIYNPYFTTSRQFVSNDVDVFAVENDGIYRYRDGEKYRSVAGTFDPEQGLCTNGTIAFAVQDGILVRADLTTGEVSYLFALASNAKLIGATEEYIYLGLPDMMFGSMMWGQHIAAYDEQGRFVKTMRRNAVGTVVSSRLITKDYRSDVSGATLCVFDSNGVQLLEQPDVMSYGMYHGTIYYSTVTSEDYTEYAVWKFDGLSSDCTVKIKNTSGVFFENNSIIVHILAIDNSYRGEYIYAHDAKMLPALESLLPGSEGSLTYMFDARLGQTYVLEYLDDEDLAYVYQLGADQSVRQVAEIFNATDIYIWNGFAYYTLADGTSGCAVAN